MSGGDKPVVALPDGISIGRVGIALHRDAFAALASGPRAAVQIGRVHRFAAGPDQPERLTAVFERAGEIKSAAMS